MSRRISASLRALVWNTYIGEENGTWTCVCGSKVTQLNFECGHVVPYSKGGPTTLENLRPICGMCNRSMGQRNLYDRFAELGVDPGRIYRPAPSTWSVVNYAQTITVWGVTKTLIGGTLRLIWNGSLFLYGFIRSHKVN